MKTFIVSLTLVALSFGTASAADLAAIGGKLIADKEGSSGRQSMLIEQKKNSALMVSFNNEGARTGLKFYRVIQNKGQKTYVRKATPWVTNRAKFEMTAKVNNIIRRHNGTFAPSDFQRSARPTNKGKKQVKALMFGSRTDKNRKAYVYPKRSGARKPGDRYFATAGKDNGQKRFNASKYRSNYGKNKK